MWHQSSLSPETITDPVKEAMQETQQPSCLPLSTVLRFFSPGAPRTLSRKHPLSSKSLGGPLTKVQKLSHTKNTSTYSKTTNGKSPPSSHSPTSGTALHLTSTLISSAKVSCVMCLIYLSAWKYKLCAYCEMIVCCFVFKRLVKGKSSQAFLSNNCRVTFNMQCHMFTVIMKRGTDFTGVQVVNKKMWQSNF